MLEGLLKGLALWIYGLMLSGVEYISNALLDVFQMDMTYFETAVPVSKDIFAIIVAVGWALLIGNLTFQAMKTMASGIGFEGEDPKILFCRTFVFGFLLLASRQICEIGMSISNSVIDLLQVPASVVIPSIAENSFSFDGSWLLVIIVGIVMMFQIVKFFFQMGERYVIMAILTILAPLAFGVGGSKSTEDIFKGWVRMFASMCIMMVMNVVFLKIMLSAMSTVPTGLTIIPWLILIVAIGRVARKIDDIISRIGMNSARTGEPLSKGNLPGMLTMMVARNLAGSVSKAASANGGSTAKSGGMSGRKSGAGTAGGKQKPTSAPHSGSKSNGNSNNFSQAGNHFNQNSSQNASQSMSQSAAQNMTGTANNSHTNNPAQMASSVAGSTMAGVQGGKIGSTQPTRPVSQNSSHQQTSRQETSAAAGKTSAGTAVPTRPPIGRNNPRQEQPRQEPPRQKVGGVHKQFSEKVGENIQNINNNSVMTTAASAGITSAGITSAGTASAGTASAGTAVPTRPPLGRNGATQQSTANNSSSVTSQSVSSTLGRNGATQQVTANNPSSVTSQNIPSPLGRKQSQTGGVSQTTSPNSPSRPSQNASTSPGRNGIDRNSPEIYTRHSEANIPPLQNPSMKNHNSNAKEPVTTVHRPPIGRGKNGSLGGDRR